MSWQRVSGGHILKDEGESQERIEPIARGLPSVSGVKKVESRRIVVAVAEEKISGPWNSTTLFSNVQAVIALIVLPEFEIAPP